MRAALVGSRLVHTAVFVASIAVAAFVARLADARENDLRALRIAAQQLERRSHRLDDEATGRTLVALAESRDTLRVRLVEALDTVRRASGATLLRHHVEERPTGSTQTSATLRLTLEGRVPHGAALLDVLEAVRTATQPWPTETRGCHVQRLDAGPAPGLTVNCTVDVLHWNDLTVPHDG